jgi:hypothetical protein
MIQVVKILIVLVLFICTPVSIAAQSNFEIFGGYRYEGVSDIEGDRITSTFSRYQFFDSLQIRTEIEQTSTPFLKVTPKPSFTIGVKQHFKLGENLEIGAGLQFLFQSFEYQSSLNNVESRTIQIDTTISTFPEFPIFQNNCDQLLFEGPNFSEFTPSDRITYLRIPLSIQIKAPGLEDFQLHLGGYYQTPIHIVSKQLRSELVQEEVNGMTICTSTTSEVKSHGTGRYALSNVGISGGFNYFITDQIRIFLIAEKTFTNLFFVESNNSTGLVNTFGRVPYQPVVFNVGISKYFNNSKSQD